ncbi:MAG: 4Fe-4S binding protein [Coriobacteriales bacterium]|jgi:ferredoxin|nr:4Fe-4S binding protein [Coriobacteriales bacterium]
MAVLNSVFGLLERLENNYITVHQNRCIVVRNRNASCRRCAEACTSGCISYADNELTISPEKCIGCGTCATVCPTCALEAHKPDDAELRGELFTAAKAAGGSCTIACVDVLKEAEGSYDRAKVVGIACLGRVEESALIALAAAGVRRIELVSGDCEGCGYEKGLQTARSVCESATTLLRAWNNDAEVHIVNELPSSVLLTEETGYDEGRRAFFFAMKGLAGRAMGYAAQEQPEEAEADEPARVRVMSDGTLPHFIPDRRERLLDCLSELGEPQDVLIETRLWGHVIIDTGLCNGCRMCATFCPTGAISKYVNRDRTSGVAYRPRDCVKCGCCADICPEDALSISEEVFAVDLLSGAVERYEMRPMKSPPNNPHAILGAMKGLLKSDQIYER